MMFFTKVDCEAVKSHTVKQKKANNYIYQLFKQLLHIKSFFNKRHQMFSYYMVNTPHNRIMYYENINF